MQEYECIFKFQVSSFKSPNSIYSFEQHERVLKIDMCISANAYVIYVSVRVCVCVFACTDQKLDDWLVGFYFMGMLERTPAVD